MRRRRAPKCHRPFPAHATPMHTARRDPVFGVTPAQEARAIQPRMIVQRAIVVAPDDVVEVNIKHTIPREHPPPEEIRLIATDDEIRRPTLRESLKPRHRVPRGVPVNGQTS